MVNVYVPRLLGVPVMVPAELSSVRPFGNLPAMRVHVYGATPPVAASVCEYAAPTVPGGRLVVVIASGATTTVIESCCVSDPAGVAESVT